MISCKINEYIGWIEQKNPLTSCHCSKSAEYAVLLGRSLTLTNDELAILSIAAPLHDLGKIRVPDEILIKPTSLTAEEFKVIKRHPLWGAEIIFDRADGNLEWLYVAEVILNHHERFDGFGYPAGINGREIPFLSQIISLADAYDAMISNRPYRSAMSKEQALSIIEAERGKQFHPKLAEEFIRLIA
ncbi:HD-GYP domain-containing protein [Desulfitobacterium dichloroeliminans LMG P-21439]|uniref:HD-GYP domain-containing protein n=1 Tax=Desulfitobacterium dichloroeliminans (strain LMG P-21439 / DCA1) TaxID=871963 RepID=L0FC58_DESDL|nr:HD-GYP domain-containing protein [Desulfitobacterium dichloroeliminans]AGA70513.1 HD-GYP domain-containing protein [Desulfitobacterium dichloroeliminans LMG P-21439]